MDWNTIVILSTVGTFFACFGIFVFVARLERNAVARSSANAPSDEFLATAAAEVGDHDELAGDELDLGNASEQANDARLGLPLGWTKMFGSWASPADDQHDQRIGHDRY